MVPIPTLTSACRGAGRSGRRLSCLALILLLCGSGPAVLAAPLASLQEAGEAGEELESLLAEERKQADRQRRRGQLKSALRILDEHLEEEAGDAASRLILARCRLEQGDYRRALEEGRRALADAPSGPAGRVLRAGAVRHLCELALIEGRASEALELADEWRADLDSGWDPRDAWALGRALWDVGDREGAERVLDAGARAPSRDLGWEGLLAKARCQRRLGRLSGASFSLEAANRLAEESEGAEPAVLVEWGSVYFEADREVKTGGRSDKDSPARFYRDALELYPHYEAALLGFFDLHRYNWNRRSRSSTEILAELLQQRPSSIEGLIAGCSADLEDGRLRAVRARLAKLRESAPARREVRTLEAALAWVEHRRDDCEAILAELLERHDWDSRPEREVGRHMLELYRFAEALPFLERAVARDSKDHMAWTQLGRAQANTGDEESARASFERATRVAGLRRDAWRENTRLVLERIAEDCVEEDHGDFTFVWRGDAADVLRTYLVPYYKQAKEELADRYGFTPGAARIEVFRKHQDFSVRSTGFEGFPALGVCFGPVVTAVSPLSGRPGISRFSWARTSFHEYTHVIHLGLSHNRCPRWITEGLATWEEVERNASWTRNMRRELVDALRNQDLIRVRDLNRAFRGPRIIFGYYQGGLLCEMLIERHGFAPMIRLLEAFDRGLDLDQAFAEVFDTTPEEIDQDFARFVTKETEKLAIEPRWSPATLTRIRLRSSNKAPESESERASWADDWCTLAWGAWQRGRKIDAQEALRHLVQAEIAPVRAELLRGEIALSDGDRSAAREIWERAIASGAEDFRVRIALGSLARESDQPREAERHFLAAEQAFPGYEDAQLCAELRLAELYLAEDRFDEAQEARQRWLAYKAGDQQEDIFDLRRRVGAWHFNNDRFVESERYYREANEIDPFVRSLHREWGETLYAAGRHAEALREFEVALLVPFELDPEADGPAEGEEQADLVAWQAMSLLELGRAEEASQRAEQALEIHADCPLAERVLDRLK